MDVFEIAIPGTGYPLPGEYDTPSRRPPNPAPGTGYPLPGEYDDTYAFVYNNERPAWESYKKIMRS